MKNSYRLFTIRGGEIKKGAEIKGLRLEDEGIDVPVVMVGDKFVRVNTKLSNRGERLLFAEIGKTKNGNKKFFPKETASTNDFIIVVLKTPLGGSGNEHTGDRIGWQCQRYACSFLKDDIHKKPDYCPKCGAGNELLIGFQNPPPAFRFKHFPGEIIASDNIVIYGLRGEVWAEGKHIIALIPKGVVFRVSYPDCFENWCSDYYKWNGKKFRTATQKTRGFLKDF